MEGQAGPRGSGQAEQSAKSCFFCDASANPDDDDSLVVFEGADHLVLLNRFPYASGHLMVAPKNHRARPEDDSPATQAAFWPLVLRCRDILNRAYQPDGFNLGMNLGSAAGAGVPDHYHFHIVPRWRGDTNFMSSVGEVRVIPEDSFAARDRLRQLF